MGIGGEVVRSNATTTKANPPSATAAATNPAKTLLRVLRWGSDLPAEILSHASGETSRCSTRARSVVRTSSSILMVSTPAGAVRSHGSSATSPFLVSTRATWRSARWVGPRRTATRDTRAAAEEGRDDLPHRRPFFEPRCVPRSLQSRGESALDREMPQAIPPHVQDRSSQIRLRVRSRKFLETGGGLDECFVHEILRLPLVVGEQHRHPKQREVVRVVGSL